MRGRSAAITAILTLAMTGGATALVHAADGGGGDVNSAYPKINAPVSEAYTAYARPRAAGDEGKNLTAGSDSRKALASVWLYREKGDLCVAVKHDSQISTAACSDGATAAGVPPVDVYTDTEGRTTVAGAAPDTVTSITILDQAGKLHTTTPANNGFSVTFPGNYAGGAMNLQNKEQFQLPTASR